jgi:hypothetical protein
MQQYSFQNTIVLVDGVEITGWADGDDVISIKRRVDSISDKVGAGGSMMVSISSDKSGEFTFKLQQGSSSNAYLSSKASTEEMGAEFFQPVRVTFQDVFRQDLASGSVGYIKRPSDITRGATAQTQEWTLVVERLDTVLGVVPNSI